MTISSRKLLEEFVENPSPVTVSPLITIPAVYRAHTAKNALESMLSDVAPGIDVAAMTLSNDWRKVSHCRAIRAQVKFLIELQTGTCYSMPQIRHRPRYPKLKDDNAGESDERGGQCSKYYWQYSQRRLTGGIMCAWCIHSICYGFRWIPRGEGRNDVFSAMITRWPKAPKRVV